MKSARSVKQSVVVFLILLVCVTVTQPAAGDSSRRLRVITRNMDTGSDFGFIYTATSQQALLAGVTATYQEILASNIPARADAVAAEIAALTPDLVGLQELTTILNGPAGDTTATNVVADTLTALMTSLANRGAHYAVLSRQINSDVQLPAIPDGTNLINVRLVDADAVLVRTDNPDLVIEHVTAKHFRATLTVTLLGQSLSIPRGWIAVDAREGWQRFRFVTTHLESLSNLVQTGEALELINGPLALLFRPVILAGDLNSDALTPTLADSPAYVLLTVSGMLDIWRILHPFDPGPTYPLHAEDPPNAATTPTQRIDMILVRGPAVPLSDSRFGNTAADLIAGVLWPSDHAGVQATMRLGDLF